MIMFLMMCFGGGGGIISFQIQHLHDTILVGRLSLNILYAHKHILFDRHKVISPRIYLYLASLYLLLHMDMYIFSYLHQHLHIDFLPSIEPSVIDFIRLSHLNI